MRNKNLAAPALFFVFACCVFFLITCNSNNNNNGKEKQINDNGNTTAITATSIEDFLQQALAQGGRIDAETQLRMPQQVDLMYQANNYNTIWTSKEALTPLGDTLVNILKNIEGQGIFATDVHHSFLLRTIKWDSLGKANFAQPTQQIVTKTEILLTDALAKICKDFKFGHLQSDSVLVKKDTTSAAAMYTNTLKQILKSKAITAALVALQPKHQGYWALKNVLPAFVQTMDRKSYTYVTYPFKQNDKNDSLYFIQKLQKRLKESGLLNNENNKDSTTLAQTIKKYQAVHSLTADGKFGAGLVKSLNKSDVEDFKRAVITLDKYKMMPDTMPTRYIWVNIPGYYLNVWDNDTLALTSKVIVGKPETQTPELTSEISDMVIYPTWTVPNSIIVKQYLPKLKKNPNYLKRIGLKLMSGSREVSPYGVNWAKYSKGIPFRVMQNSGNNNALGVFKFNFPNKYAVYLHDTNQRYLFANKSRALSHGCVRVQQWQDLAGYVAKVDSIYAPKRDTLPYTADSIKSWLVKKELRRLEVQNKIPVYIRYFSVEGINNKIVFYDDIYAEDKVLREKYLKNYN
jgi:L,D-transpeptidase YcbB